MSNFGLYKAFDEKGIGYAKTAVGDKYVYEYMAKNGCRIGGEQSGHIIFSKYASTGDGILTSLKMMEVMLAKKLPMSKLAEPLKIYPQVLENVRVTDKKAAQDDEAVQAAVKAVAEALGDTGRILVRESGTEPVVRVMVEAPDHDTCQKYVSQVVGDYQEQRLRSFEGVCLPDPLQHECEPDSRRGCYFNSSWFTGVVQPKRQEVVSYYL